MQGGGAAAILVREEPKGAGKGTGLGLGLGAEPKTVLRANWAVWMIAGEASMVDGKTQLHSA